MYVTYLKMRLFTNVNSSLVSRTRYVKHGCKGDRQRCVLCLGHKLVLRHLSNGGVVPLTSTQVCLKKSERKCSGDIYKTKLLNMEYKTVCCFPITSLCCKPVCYPNFFPVRYIHLGFRLSDKEPLKPSSKVEQTVQVLKHDLKDKEKSGVDKPPEEKPKKPLKERIKEELLHYYHGFRLLFIDIKISSKLCLRLLRGYTLTRREHRLLVRTTSDMFRLVPFSVFIIVPFMEFLLPVAIKFFPGMLPSTFQTAKDEEEKMKQALKVKLEMAKFLQKTLDDMAVQAKGRNTDETKEFTEFFAKVRQSGQTATTEEILKFSQLFEDEITLDSLRRPQLIALCRVLEMPTLGTNNFLRFQLRMKLRSLTADDKMIQKEGLDSLTPSELQQACRARGMRAYGVSEARLKAQMAQWLDLSLNEKVPPSLLLLSRALLLPDTIPATDQLKATISILPDTAVTKAKANIGELKGKVDNKAKIEVLEQEVRLIKEEQRERREAEKRQEKEELVDKAPVLSTSTEEAKKEITSTDLEKLEDALDTVGKQRKKLLVEKEELDGLKEELADYQEDVADLKHVLKAKGDPKVEIKESKGAQRLYKKVNSMISKMDAVLGQLEQKKEKQLKDLKKKDPDQLRKCEELVSIEELISAIKKLQKVPDESLIQRISEVLTKIDIDRDGAIRVDDVLKVIELVGRENVKLDKKQLDEIIELMSKEEIIEIEEQIEKVLEKQRLQAEVDKKKDEKCEEPASKESSSGVCDAQTSCQIKSRADKTGKSDPSSKE